MKQSILKLLSDKGNGISFVDLSKIDGFKGDLSIGNPDKNQYLWFECSQHALDALNSLLKENKIEIVSTSFLVYHADGLIPKYPLANQNRKFKTPRWTPAVINKGPKFDKN